MIAGVAVAPGQHIQSVQFLKWEEPQASEPPCSPA